MRIVIEAVLPPTGARVLDAKRAALEAGIEAAMKGPIRTTVQTAMKQRVKNWADKPWFVSKFSKNASKNGGMSILIYPTGANVKKWQWVSGGTPSHVIRASNVPLLRFQRVYTPKTRPGNVYGKSGAKSGPWINTPSVQHPGIAARDFEKHIANEEEGKIIALLSSIITTVLTS